MAVDVSSVDASSQTTVFSALLAIGWSSGERIERPFRSIGNRTNDDGQHSPLPRFAEENQSFLVTLLIENRI